MNRLSLRIFASFFAALLLIGAGAIFITWWVLSERQDEGGIALRDVTGEAARALAAGGREGLVAWAEESNREERRGRRVLLIDESGQDILGRRLPPRLRGPAALERDVALPGAPGVTLRVPQRLPLLIAPDGEQFRLLAPPRPRLRLFGRPDLRLPLLLLALGVAALVSGLLARSITRPILDLQRATGQLAAGRLGARVAASTTRRRDELGRLGSAFDAMAGRLSELIEARERLLRDVSHELRSPLARMRLATGLARQPGADVMRQLERVDREIERLDALIGSILDVSRLEAGAGSMLRERLDLVALVDRLAIDARFEADANGRRLEWTPPLADVVVDADPHWLSAAIENVIRNALRYTPPGSAVRLDLDRLADGRARLAVRDSGPGLPDSERQRVFEPFHRVETDRGRDTGGTGLGLAIAARVMRAHGGSIEAHNLPGSRPDAPAGLEIRLWLPLAAGAATAAREAPPSQD
jgi:two-component system sensor histidine kinase CpxA